MAGYLARRLVLSVLTLFLITAAVYSAIRLLPGDPTAGEEAAGAAGPERDWLRHSHANESIPSGYARWLADIARLDFGASLAVQPGRPVSGMVAEALPFTLALGSLSFVLTLWLAVPLGVLSAWRPDSAAARGSAWLLYALHALPAFWIALALQHLVSGGLGLLPPIGAGPIGDLSAGLPGFLSRAPYWILPTLALTLGSLAFVIRFCMVNLVVAARRHYATAARARGAGDARVLWGHALANSAVPLISLAGLMLPGIVSGSVLVETIFALPGVGRMFFTAAARRDYPVLMAVSLLAAGATLAASLIADLLYRAADPRMRAADDEEGREAAA
jgi:peptide/nickel transport system permease protein